MRIAAFGAAVRGGRRVWWRRSRWRELAWEPGLGAGVAWSVVELRDSGALEHEGRAMRHCVASYASWCSSGRASIWSLRRRIDDGDARSVLTIEIDPRTATIVQVRAHANRAPRGEALDVMRRWAAREQLAVASTAL